MARALFRGGAPARHARAKVAAAHSARRQGQEGEAGYSVSRHDFFMPRRQSVWTRLLSTCAPAMLAPFWGGEEGRRRAAASLGLFYAA